jgi:hypothetical protein
MLFTMSIETVCFQHAANPLFLLAEGAILIQKKHFEETKAGFLDKIYLIFPFSEYSLAW